eukprot:7391191-Prymnesium_polylepis.1
MKRAPPKDENRTRMREWLRAQAVLVDEPSRVMADVAAMANAADVMVLSEHGLWAAEMEAVLRWVREELGMDSVGAAACAGRPGGGASAGVMMLWREGAYEREDEPSRVDVLIPGRMVSVLLKDEAKRLTWMAGVYMRNRQDSLATDDWETMATHVYERERLVLGGDLNAETLAAMTRGGRVATASDRALVRDGGVVVVSDDRAETYERAGTTLDYWLATEAVAGEMTKGCDRRRRRLGGHRRD